eukprot:CAMPEP_0201874182 /NCGR_PEP_ID=MMETSP0902-20130614/6507_1 /ASSEMBLY_ACC=CAM_ASM_000551 /TAXON_ID=420261 /ORGANISM="Thalassiosira antarctica, Strain CCMP982" /LENGTH=371 /DNA_ID=CAMNT_0048400993 /DNA_START=108 /DNA_END=1223 /DNA_ORIENTATION=-
MTSTNAAAAVVVARLLLPDDANPVGNVHGGTTLKLMEEAGMIAATRHMSSSEANRESRGNCLAALVRFDTMAFHKPIFVGEVASCTCEIIFTSNQSILVEVVVTAEDISKGKTRVTNTGWLWYVPLAPSSFGPTGEKKDWKIVQVLPMAMPDEEAAIQKSMTKYGIAKAKYEMRKKSSQNSGEDFDAAGGANDAKEINNDLDTFKSQYTAPSEGRSPTESEQVLCQMVLPGDCSKDHVAFGGFVMKLMDNAAGCSAWRHCRANVVTVAISDMDFVSWVRLGDLCTIRSKVVYASSKSLEIEVVASVASAASNRDEDTVVAKGLFTFVSIGSDGKVLSVPKLRLESDEDMRNAYLGKRRYEAAKRARLEGSN